MSNIFNRERFVAIGFRMLAQDCLTVRVEIMETYVSHTTWTTALREPAVQTCGAPRRPAQGIRFFVYRIAHAGARGRAGAGEERLLIRRSLHARPHHGRSHLRRSGEHRRN